MKAIKEKLYELSQMEFADYEYLVLMGISTGGPKTLNTVIQNIDPAWSATYVIVQHMLPGFTKNLAQRLNECSKIIVKEAEHGEKLRRGVAYIAEAGKHLRIVNSNAPEIAVSDEEPYQSHKPSVNIMVSSVAKLKTKKKIIGVIMTGMGSDGLEGFLELKKSSDCIIIAQDKETSTVYGMPRAIINAGLADYVVPESDIAAKLKMIMGG